MTEETRLARRYIWQANLGTVSVPVWTQIVGLIEFKAPTAPVNQADSDYDSDGNKGYTKTMQEWSIEAKLSHKQNDSSYVVNPAHAYLFAASKAFGAASVVHMRYYDRHGAADAWEGYGLITWTPDGGDNEQLDRVTVTVMPSATSPALTSIANPLNATPLPIVASIAPTGGTTAGGTLVVISGAYYTGVTGATGVKFGAVNATSYQFIGDNKIAAIAPAGSAGTVQVKVTTPNGASVDTVADDYTYA